MVSPGSSFPPNPFHLPFTTLDPHLTSQSKLLYEMRFVDKNIYLSSFEVFGTFFSTNQKGRSFSALLSTGFCSTSVYSTLWLRFNFIFLQNSHFNFFQGSLASVSPFFKLFQRNLMMTMIVPSLAKPLFFIPSSTSPTLLMKTRVNTFVWVMSETSNLHQCFSICRKNSVMRTAKPDDTQVFFHLLRLGFKMLI